MTTFDPGDIVRFKDRFSPEMIVTVEADGKVNAFWEDVMGVVKMEGLPAASLEVIAMESRPSLSSLSRKEFAGVS